MNRKSQIAWVLYDFANSGFFAVIPATIYSKHYALVVVGNDHGQGDFWWGTAVTTTMLLVGLSAAPLGAIADLSGWRKRLLFGFTYLGVVATALMATVGPGDVVWGWLLAVAACGSVEAAVAFYNAYLPVLAPPEYRGRLSAYGFAVGYVGSAVALAAALPFAAAGAPEWAFLATAVFFGVFALPAFASLPGQALSRERVDGLRTVARSGFDRALGTLKWIRREPPLRRFLFSYFCFADGINTVIYFSSVFAGHTLGFDTLQIVQLYFVVQLSALAGAWLSASQTDVRGPKPILLISLLQWCLVVVLTALVGTKGQFFVVSVFAGVALGSVQAASRTLMASLIPEGKEAEMFGFYAVCGKMAAIVGPLVFGIISRSSGGNQRLAVLAIGLFFVVGLVSLWGVRAGGPPGARGPSLPAS